MPEETEQIEVVYDHAHLELLSARLERSDGEQALPVEQRQRRGRLRFLLIGLALVAVATAVIVGSVVGTSNSRSGDTAQGVEGGIPGLGPDLGQPTASPSVLGATSPPTDAPVIPEISDSPTVGATITAAPVTPAPILTQGPTIAPDPAEFTTVLASGDRMLQAEPVLSPSGKYTFGLSQDGDLLLLDANAGVIVWQLGGDGAVVLTMQVDGNLVLRREDDTVSWDSKSAGAEGASLTLDDNGVLKVAVDNGEPVWLGGLAGNAPIATPAPSSASDPGTPTATPTTSSPTPAPTGLQTPGPVIAATPAPTSSPPIAVETPSPVVSMTAAPTSDAPTAALTLSPISTEAPSRKPTPTPTSTPSKGQDISEQPSSLQPTPEPTLDPTPKPSLAPTLSPTVTATLSPTVTASQSPTVKPTLSPTPAPTDQPSASPVAATLAPTFDPDAYVTVLTSGARLFRDDPIASQNNLYFFGLNGNGDMILYNQAGEILWLVQGDGAYLINMGTDGNMILQRQDGSITWFSLTGLNGGATLRLDNRGRVFIAKGDGPPLWTGGLE